MTWRGLTVNRSVRHMGRALYKYFRGDSQSVPKQDASQSVDARLNASPRGLQCHAFQPSRWSSRRWWWWRSPRWKSSRWGSPWGWSRQVRSRSSACVSRVFALNSQNVTQCSGARQFLTQWSPQSQLGSAFQTICQQLGVTAAWASLQNLLGVPATGKDLSVILMNAHRTVSSRSIGSNYLPSSAQQR